MSDRSKQANKKRVQFWRYHLKEWSGSGLSQNAYCRANNLKPGRFTYWKNKFKSHNLPVELVQVKPESYQHNSILRLNIASGFQVEIPDGFSMVTLSHVLEVLAGA